jgi:hypothetical protein
MMEKGVAGAAINEVEDVRAMELMLEAVISLWWRVRRRL